MTEDVINGLSRFGGLAVIARNTAFSYRSRSVDLRLVGEELGVGYIVEGSVRRFGERIRITARLVDAATGVQRWSEQFDRGLGDIFAVQDEITRAIVAIVVAHLGNAEIERSIRKSPSSFSAYDLTLRGDQALMLAEQFWDARHVYVARSSMPRRSASILMMRGSAPSSDIPCQGLRRSDLADMGRRDELEHGLELARRAVGIAPNLPLARAQLGWAKAWMKEPDEAIAEFEKAAALNPSFVDYRFALILAFAGEPERALQAAQDCVRLDPFYGSMLPVIRGLALYLLGRYAEALSALRETRGRGAPCPRPGRAGGHIGAAWRAGGGQSGHGGTHQAPAPAFNRAMAHDLRLPKRQGQRALRRGVTHGGPLVSFVIGRHGWPGSDYDAFSRGRER